jgi:hypothetical protein
VYGHVSPSPDGTVLYTSAGVATSRKLAGSRYALAAAEGGGFYLSIDVADAPHGSDTKASKLRLHLTGEDEPLADLDDVELPRRINVWDREPITSDERVILVESARVVLVLPAAGEEVAVHKLDPWAVLEKSKRDHLVVASAPPLYAVRGTTFDYAPRVRSNKGGLKLSLDAGPEGMKLVEGRVSWAVPKDFRDAPVTVILNAADASGKTVFQTFDLRVIDAADVPKPPGPPGRE